MASRPDWPQWWQWRLAFSGHLLRRMIERELVETDVRAMLHDACDIEPHPDPGRWIVHTRLHGHRWRLVVEPNRLTRRLALITAYEVE